MRNYWIVFKSGIFELWDGPIPNESNFHYAKFHGLKSRRGEEIWVLERSDVPESSVGISIDLAEELISKSIEVC